MSNSPGVLPHHLLVKRFDSFSLGAKKAFAFSIFLVCSSSALNAAAATLAPKTLPTNGQVVSGSATISQSQTASTATMNVNQTSQRAVINWDNFNVGKNATVNFNQPNASAVTLNRVTGGNASVIEGAVRANGQVVFVNENGVTFTKGATVNAAGVVATTMNIADKDFMEGKSTYQGNGAGTVINEGKIKTNVDGGYIALLAPEVRNDGYLIAKKGAGTVALGSGEQITLDFKGNSLISLKVDKAAYQALIENKRVVEVNGGLVVIAAGSANQLMATVIKNTGKISASSMVNNGGVIELVANTVTQAGKAVANSQTAQGGQINIAGNDITVAQSSKTTATGATGGGQVNIGLATTKVSGGSQVNAVTPPTPAIIAANSSQAAQSNQMAKTVTVEQNAVIDASATKTGNGGTIAIWSQVQTTIAGILQSMGGALSGNGGFIETSSKGQVSIAPTMSINTSANNQSGKSGTWLLDPIDLTIDRAAANLISQVLANSNVTIAVTNSTIACPIGACTQNGTASLTIASGADILKAGTNYTTLTLSSAGIFNLNANISGQNLDVIISSSIAYLNVGTTIAASKVTVQAQTIYSAGTIQTSNYLSNTNPGSLGNVIQLLAQAIYVSGRLSANAPQGVAGSIKLDANTIFLQNGAVLEASAEEGGQITVAANDSTWSGAAIQANGGNGRGGTLAISAANDQHFDQALLQSNGTTDGGAITITTASGDLIIQNSTIQTNGSNGRGGSIGASASNYVTFQNTAINANGNTQGGTIKIGNDADHGTLPFALLTSLDQYTSISAAQTDSNATNKNGGFIETSGQTLNLLASINAGRGGMWLLDPYLLTITGAQNVNGSSATNTYIGSVGLTTISNSTLNAALNIAAVTITDSSGDITINGPILGTNSLTIVASSGNIQVNAGITLTGVGSSITLKASGYISTNGANTFQTNGGDVIFWSNSGNVSSTSATSANFIYVDSGTQMLTHGGAIYLAGGASSPVGTTTANGNQYPTGYAFTGTQTTVSSAAGLVGVGSGVLLGPYAGRSDPIILKSAGGNVVIAGAETKATSDGLPGFSSQSSFLIDSGTGNISISGKAHSGHGIELGYGSAYSNIVITSASTSPNAIQISGTSEVGYGYEGFWAVHLADSNTPGVLIQGTGLGGGVSVTGINATSGVGLYLSDIAILSSGGPVRLNATTFVMQGTTAFLGACSGSSYPCSSYTIGSDTYTPVTNSSGSVTINVDSRSVGAYVWNGVLTVNTTAGLTIAPYTSNGWSGTAFNWSGTNSVSSGGINTFTADANSFIGAANMLVVRGINTLTIGAANNTNDVNISQDVSPFGAVTVYGGNINVNATINNLLGNMLLQSTSGDITINSGINWGAGTTLTLSAYANIYINSHLSSTAGTMNVIYGRQYSNGCTASLNPVCSAFLVKGSVGMDSGSTLSIQQGSSSFYNHLYTIINTLGVQGDTSGTTLQGINTSSSAGYYAIGNDIDANATASWNSGTGFTPIGSAATSGIFGNTSDGYIQGLGNRIIHLTINATAGQYIGLVTQLGPNGQISNLGLDGGMIKTRTNTTVGIGSFVGYVGSWSTVGLVGNYSSASVVYEPTNNPTSYVFIGGLAADTNQALKPQLKDNAFTGTINVTIPGNATSAIVYVGGLLGRLVQNPLSNSFSSGTITVDNFAGAGMFVGGLVGEWWGAGASQISNSYSSTTINLGNHTGARAAAVGGLVGEGSNANCTANTNLCGTIANSYAVGNITTGTNWYSGGILGYFNSTASVNPYKYNNVYSSVNINNPTAANIGGIIGYINATPGSGWASEGQPIFTNTYWNTDLEPNAIGQNISNASTTGATGLTAVLFGTRSSFPSFDFANTWTYSGSINSGLPSLMIYSPLKVAPTYLYVLLVPGSSVYGQTPTFTYGIYNSADGTSIVSPALSNLVSGSVVWGGTVPDASSSVGSYVVRYLSGLNISNSSYSLLAGNGKSWTITPAPLGIQVNATYNGGNVFTPSNSTITTSGLVSGQSITSVSASSNLVGPGNYVTSLSGTGGFVASNYMIYNANEVGNAGIQNGAVYSGIPSGSSNLGGTNLVALAPKPITITNNVVSATYDANTSYAALVASAGYSLSAPLVGGDAIGALNQTVTISGALASGIAQAGTFVSTPGAAVLSTGNANNYLFSYAPTSNTVAKANLRITATPSLLGNTYTGATYTSTYTTTFLSATDANNATITGTVSESNAGTYSSHLAVTGSSLVNYNTPIISDANFVIAKAPLIVKAISAKREAGAVFSGGNGVAYIGLQNGDTPSVLSGTLTYSGSSQGASTAGTYAIVPSGLTSQNYAISYASGDLVLTPQPVVLVPVFIPPPVVVPVVAPPPPPAAPPVMVVVAPPPSVGSEGAAPPPGQVMPPPRATMTVVAPDGTVSLGAAAPAAPPAAPPSSPPAAASAPATASAPPAAPPGAGSSSSNSSSSASSSADGKSSSSKDGNGKSERVGKYDARKLAALKEADKTDAKKSGTGTAAKYAGKYANGFRAAEKVATKEAAKEGAKEGVAKPGTNTAKAAPPREGKYSNRLNALANSGAVNMPLAQNQLTATGLPPLPGAPVEVAVPTVLRGGDSLSQSYDDVPSIRNSGVANVGRSRNTENYHESLESVNLMSTLNLFIVH
ncbi:filamentous hemagglutinin N-terminal domain-containing protein [Polynucleobacter sp. UK-Kesae-W10]|uniref:two-partner secretion domain-containing protein n=1 Tax=Polynucleobacter sp. UK-Kesae-W10 TaxID=1819738 RepID=UPI001C0B733E|nr:filamentous hemagglutinin N-terminal domain-containing protein [Polynucleobacter sp. UK-Kesae-W10]MBU3577858.1 filamentous hemagglutinin N-terminal domain-containing protein [Polynucleobacter sp. UK-Kesae-W10]